MSHFDQPLLHLRFEFIEAARILHEPCNLVRANSALYHQLCLAGRAGRGPH
jgi:hypothetical protein